MAKSSTFGYTNTGANENVTVKPISIGEVTNYALVEDEEGITLLSNLTSPVDQGERVSVKAQLIPKVTSSVNNLHPAPVSQGVQYSIKVEDLLSTTDDTDSDFRVDDPIVVTLTVKHTLSKYITPDIVNGVIARALGALYCADGTSRINALMRLATKAVND